MFRTTAIRIAAAATIAALLAPTMASAAVYSNGNKTATFDVTVQIIADCTIAAQPLDFGASQGVLSSTVSSTTSLQVTCTNTTPYNVGLSAGTVTGSTTASRLLGGTGANTGTVAFNLTMAAGAGNWGNTQGTDTKSGTGTGALQSMTVYGAIPAQNTPQPDTYKTTITATVYF
jgi:spore coat protein U-like protein